MFKESLPHFKAEMPASLPLTRNQEVESWLREIENITQPRMIESFIRAARSSCRGPADLIINLPVFDSKFVGYLQRENQIEVSGDLLIC